MNNRIVRHAVTTLCMAATLLMFRGEVAAAAVQGPVDIIKARNQSVERILRQSGDSVSDATREQLKDVINSFIDFNELSKRALGKYWDERNEEERKRFVDVFSQLIKNSSVKKLEIYKADRMVYQEPRVSDGRATVTTVAYKDRKNVEVTYQMHRVNGEWRVYDMDIDGVSTARNYRDSFYKQIAKSSYEDMYDKLVQRLQEG